MISISFDMCFFLFDCLFDLILYVPVNNFSVMSGHQGGSLIFSYIRRLGLFLGFKILNFNIFGGFQQNEYFLGYEDFVDIFLGSSQNWTKFRGHLYTF